MDLLLSGIPVTGARRRPLWPSGLLSPRYTTGSVPSGHPGIGSVGIFTAAGSLDERAAGAIRVHHHAIAGGVMKPQQSRRLSLIGCRGAAQGSPGPLDA